MSRWLCLPVVAVLASAQTPQREPDGYAALGKGRYLEARDLFASAAFAADGSVRDDRSFQSWAQYSPMVTSELPLDAFLRDPDAPAADPNWTAAVRSASARPALAEIVRRARETSIVILNEAHYSPRDRAFALEVARALRPLGYSILAVEALFNDPDPGRQSPSFRLVAEGHVRFSTGSYTRDPVFAGYLRMAVQLGYRPVAYEILPTQMRESGDIAVREAAQTANLMTAIFAHDPRAKVLIHVGHSHVAEQAIDRDGEKVEWMAARLKRATGVDPLTIDQTTLTDLSPQARTACPLAAARAGDRDAILFQDGRPLVLGQYAGGVDLQVVHPARRYRYGRPTWLAALGGKPTRIPAALLPRSGTRLVQAFAADAPADAVPLDQVLVTAGKPAPYLMLPPGRVRYATQP